MSQAVEAPPEIQTTARPPYRLLNPPTATSSPLIICLHGSGESCSPSWDTLALAISNDYRVLLYDRGSGNVTPPEFVEELARVLNELPPPYVLIAHSYGGTFARQFLHVRPQTVAGMVMVETGQETLWDPEVERQQYQQQVLGSKPLSVIRGNSFIEKFKALDADHSGTRSLATLSPQRKMLEQWDAEDERLKKAQLALSKNHRYVHIPDCGHHVIRDRPDVVVEEVRWVMTNLSIDEKKERSELPRKPIDVFPSLWRRLRRLRTS